MKSAGGSIQTTKVKAAIPLYIYIYIYMEQFYVVVLGSTVKCFGENETSPDFISTWSEEMLTEQH